MSNVKTRGYIEFELAYQSNLHGKPRLYGNGETALITKLDIVISYDKHFF